MRFSVTVTVTRSMQLRAPCSAGCRDHVTVPFGDRRTHRLKPLMCGPPAQDERSRRQRHRAAAAAKSAPHEHRARIVFTSSYGATGLVSRLRAARASFRRRYDAPIWRQDQNRRDSRWMRHVLPTSDSGVRGRAQYGRAAVSRRNGDFSRANAAFDNQFVHASARVVGRSSRRPLSGVTSASTARGSPAHGPLALLTCWCFCTFDFRGRGGSRYRLEMMASPATRLIACRPCSM